jgi:hypothetical protein
MHPTPARRRVPQLAGLAGLVVLCLAASACSTAHTARPLGQGKHAVHVSVGGPIVAVGGQTRIPLPLTTLTYKIGLTDRADFFVGWHVIETFVNEGNLFFDVGASYYFLDQRGPLPGVSAAFTLSPYLNSRSGWASLDLQLTASWAFGPRERHLVYLGFHNFLTPVRPQLVATAPYSFSPYLGAQLRLGPNRELGLSGEIKWHRPYQDTSRAVISYVGPGSHGALAFIGGITFYVGKRRKSASEGQP